MKVLSEKLRINYPLLMAICTGIYFFASVETVSVIDYTSLSALFKIIRYLCYLAMGLLFSPWEILPWTMRGALSAA